MKKTTLIFSLFLILVSCADDDEYNEIVILDVNTEIVFQEFIPNTGNNTSRFRYQIKMTNLNDFDINGYLQITTTSNGSNLSTTQSFPLNTGPCNLIEANSECFYDFDEEESLDILMPNSILITNASYVIIE